MIGARGKRKPAQLSISSNHEMMRDEFGKVSSLIEKTNITLMLLNALTPRVNAGLTYTSADPLVPKQSA